MLIPYSRTDAFDCFLNEGCITPLSLGVAHPKKEVSEDLCAAIGVFYLWMKLDAVDFVPWFFDGGNGVLGFAGGLKAGWQGYHMVAMAVPDAQRAGQAGEQ